MAASPRRAHPPQRVRGATVAVAGALVAASLLWLFPPFRIVRLDSNAAPPPAAGFDARRFARAFWTSELVPASRRATDAAQLLAAHASDPRTAAERYARRLGLGGTPYYFVSGEGRIVSVDNEAVHVAIGGNPAPAVVLEMGLVFGNAVRDATGLADVNRFPNSQAFNALAAELNHCVEEQVLPALRTRAKAGARIRFAGCGEVPATAAQPLRLVPIVAEVP